MKFLIKNGSVVTEKGIDILDILIEDDTIVQIGRDLEKESGYRFETIDAEQNYIIPGLVDMCTHIGDPGFENREDIQSVSKSAAKGAFTSISCQPTTSPIIDNKTVVNYIKTKGKLQSLVNIYPYGSMTKGGLGFEISEIGEMIAEGIVAVSDGGESVADAGLMLNILRYTKMFDIPVITSCENKNLAGNGVMNSGKMSTKIGLKGIPREAEDIMVARNILLARENSRRLHIENVSTKGAVELIREYKTMGMEITCSTNPHYFTLTEDAVESYNTYAKVKPPLRTKEDMQSIIDGLVDGTIDVIATGHLPTTYESKNIEFDKASYGISSLETSFFISYTHLVKTGIMSLNKLIELMSTNPARILGLTTKGKIRVGDDADLCIISKDGKYKIDATTFASRAKFSPYDGAEVYGTLVCTMVGGQIVYLR